MRKCKKSLDLADTDEEKSNYMRKNIDLISFRYLPYLREGESISYRVFSPHVST